MKSAILINTYGCRIISGDADIVIDPMDAEFTSVPDCVIFSCAEAVSAHCLNGLRTYKDVPIYTAAATKKLLNLNFIKYNFQKNEELTDKNTIEEILSCRQRTKNTLRKHMEFKADIIFYGNAAAPGSCHVVIKTTEHTILYTHALTEPDKPIPEHDILIINANKKAPIEEMLQKLPDIVIKIEDFSHLYNVLSYFNKENNTIKVGVDETLSAPACEYLKLDCTVFSKNVRPLSSYKKAPSIIITTQPEKYAFQTVLPSYLFTTGPRLYDIYSFASSSAARQKIVITDETCGMHTRGNIVFCGGGSAIEL